MNSPQPPVVVVVFVMSGCPACEEYLPRFQRIAAPYMQAGVPVLVYDAASEDQRIQSLADRWGVEATPTTIVARHGPGMLKEEGAIDDHGIKTLMDVAYRVHLNGR